VAKQLVQLGNTNRSEYIFIQNSSSTTGAGLTGLTYLSAGLSAAHVVERGTASSMAFALLASANAAWTSGGFIEVDAALMPGVYRYDVPNVVFATADKSVVMLKGATNMAPVILEYQIVGFNPDDGVRLGLTAIPNAAAGAVGGLPTGDASGRVTVASNADKTGYSLTTAPLNATQTADSVWNALIASYTTANSFGARVVRTRSTSPSNEVTITGSFHIAADVHELQPGVIIAADFAAGAINANALATDAVNEIADGILKRNLDSSGDEVSTTSNGRTVRNALRILRNKIDASGGTQVDVYNEADTTVIWSQPITTNASANPIVKVGP
jgi:hypothetical protein